MSMETESSSPSPPTPNTTVIAMSTKTQPQPLLSSHSHSLSFGESVHDVHDVHDVVSGIFDLPPPNHHQGQTGITLQQIELQSQVTNTSPPSQYQTHSHSHIGSLICLAPDAAAGSVLPSNCNDGNGTGHTPGSLTHATSTYIPADSL